jgi:hypothetical protein
MLKHSTRPPLAYRVLQKIIQTGDLAILVCVVHYVHVFKCNDGKYQTSFDKGAA